MRYFIGHVFQGEAAEYVDSLREDISERFGTQPLHEKIPPHITLKAPFETDDIETVTTSLKKFADSEIPSRFVLNGFSHISERVIFIDVDPSARLIETSDHLHRLLRTIPGLTFKENEESLPHFHVTLATRLDTDTYSQIWDYLSKMDAPHFDCIFDSLALLQYEGGKWIPHAVYPFSK